MSDPETPATEGPPAFPIQLRQAYVYEAQLKRRARQRGDSRNPTLDAQIVGSSPDPAGNAFNVVLGATVRMPFGARPVLGLAEFSCSVIGRFEHSEPVPDDFKERFCQKEALILLWPYLRASMAELTRMAELPIPPLPTLDVSRVVAAGEGLKVHSEQTPHRTRSKKEQSPGPEAAVPV
jgi:preprotein translocase subunit SecB